ncbi:MAG: HEPN domain-containing protein [archaeon]
MDLKELLNKQIIAKVNPDRNQSFELIKLAGENLVAAEDNLKMKHFDWGLAIAYNAMLSAARGLMALKGYRAFAEQHHLAVVQFCAAVMPTESTILVVTFNRYRVRRHNVVYGQRESVGEDEVKNAIDSAKKFVEKIKELAEKNK